MVKSISPGFKSGMRFEINTVTKPRTPTPSTANKPPRAVKQHKEMMSRTSPKKAKPMRHEDWHPINAGTGRRLAGHKPTRMVASRVIEDTNSAYKSKKRKGKK